MGPARRSGNDLGVFIIHVDNHCLLCWCRRGSSVYLHFFLVGALLIVFLLYYCWPFYLYFSCVYILLKKNFLVLWYFFIYFLYNLYVIYFVGTLFPLTLSCHFLINILSCSFWWLSAAIIVLWQDLKVEQVELQEQNLQRAQPPKQNHKEQNLKNRTSKEQNLRMYNLQSRTSNSEPPEQNLQKAEPQEQNIKEQNLKNWTPKVEPPKHNLKYRTSKAVSQQQNLNSRTLITSLRWIVMQCLHKATNCISFLAAKVNMVLFIVYLLYFSFSDLHWEIDAPQCSKILSLFSIVF